MKGCIVVERCTKIDLWALTEMEEEVEDERMRGWEVRDGGGGREGKGKEHFIYIYMSSICFQSGFPRKFGDKDIDCPMECISSYSRGVILKWLSASYISMYILWILRISIHILPNRIKGTYYILNHNKHVQASSKFIVEKIAKKKKGTAEIPLWESTRIAIVHLSHSIGLYLSIEKSWLHWNAQIVELHLANWNSYFAMPELHLQMGSNEHDGIKPYAN